MNIYTHLTTRRGTQVQIGYDFEGRWTELLEQGELDTLIVASEDGLSPLGAVRSFLADEVGVAVQEICCLADWNRRENPEVSLVALPSRKEGSRFRGAILAACETCECYKQFAVPRYGRPYRDFYYNVNYEALAYAAEHWGAQNVAITHLSGSGNFHPDIAGCQAEAFGHCCEEYPCLERLVFVGCCIGLQHLKGIDRLHAEREVTRHRPIRVRREISGLAEFLHLEWSGNEDGVGRSDPDTHRLL